MDLIKNMPAEAESYEFVVVIPNADHYTFVGMYADGHKTAKAALEYGGVVIHNVRIHGYQPPEPKKKHYIFSGMWTWDCWAVNKDEAYTQFNNTFLDKFDIDTNNYKITVEED